MLPLLGFFPTGNLTPEALDVVGRSSLQHDENISRNALASGPPDEPWTNARRLVSRESGTMSDYDTDEEARRLLQRSLAINESLGNQRGLAASLHELANIEFQAENRDEARRLWERSIRMNESICNVAGAAATKSMLAQLEAIEGRFERAIELASQAVLELEQLGYAQAEQARGVLRGIEQFVAKGG